MKDILIVVLVFVVLATTLSTKYRDKWNEHNPKFKE